MGNTKNKAVVKTSEPEQKNKTSLEDDKENEDPQNEGSTKSEQAINPKQEIAANTSTAQVVNKTKPEAPKEDDAAKTKHSRATLSTSNSKLSREIKGDPSSQHLANDQPSLMPDPSATESLAPEQNSEGSLNDDKSDLLNEIQNLSLRFDDRNNVLIIPDVEDANTYVSVDFLLAGSQIQVGKQTDSSNRNWVDGGKSASRTGFKRNYTGNVRPYDTNSIDRRRCSMGNRKPQTISPRMLNFNVPTSCCGQYNSFPPQCRRTPICLPSRSTYNTNTNLRNRNSPSYSVDEDPNDSTQTKKINPPLGIPVVIIHTQFDDPPPEEDIPK